MNRFQSFALSSLLLVASIASASPAGSVAPAARYSDDDTRAASGASAWLGVRVQDITPELRDAMKLDDDRGALVSDVIKKSPAARAGIEKGDVIVGIDGRAIESASDLTEMVNDMSPGAEIRISTIRNGKESKREAKLDSRPNTRERSRLFPPVPRHDREMRGGGHLGVESQQMDDDLAAYFGTTGGRGVLVTRVQEDSPAAKAGVRAGDIIFEIDGSLMSNPSELLAAVREKESGEEVRLLILRQRRESEIAATLDDAPPFAGSRQPWLDSLRGSMRGLRDRWSEERELRANDLKRQMETLREEIDRLREEIDALKKKIDR